jgi:hypothetical protein
MNPQEEQERYRYLQLKQKMGSPQQDQKKPSLGSQISGWSKMPEKMAGATMDVMKGQIQNPVGKGAMNLLSKTIPPTFSRLNLGLMGGLEGAQALSRVPKVAEMGRGLAGQLESAAGSPKGTLEHGFESMKNFFGKGKSAAGPMYKEAGSVKGGLLGGMYKPEEIVDTVNAALKEGKPIHPSEALKYRKAIDILSKSGKYVKDELFEMRNTADEVVKQSEKYRMADPIYKRGMLNEALRGVLPKNKYGTTSAFKTAIMAGVPGMGALLSPAVQGAGATALGGLLRMNPAVIALLNSLLSQGSSQTSQQPPNTP